MKKLLKKQEQLQEFIYGKDWWKDFKSQIVYNVVAIISELGEFLQEINWKPWKRQNKQINCEKAFEELIDILFFYMNLIIVFSKHFQYSYNDVIKKYEEKWQKNIKRIKNKEFKGDVK